MQLEALPFPGLWLQKNPGPFVQVPDRFSLFLAATNSIRFNDANDSIGISGHYSIGDRISFRYIPGENDDSNWIGHRTSLEKLMAE